MDRNRLQPVYIDPIQHWRQYRLSVHLSVCPHSPGLVYTPFTRSSKHRANVEKTSSKYKACIKHSLLEANIKQTSSKHRASSSSQFHRVNRALGFRQSILPLFPPLCVTRCLIWALYVLLNCKILSFFKIKTLLKLIKLPKCINNQPSFCQCAILIRSQPALRVNEFWSISWLINWFRDFDICSALSKVQRSIQVDLI